LARENTLAAFDLALEQGCDGFEFDVRATQDGVGVVCHDEKFSGLMIASTSADRVEKLPRLEDVLSRYAGRAFLNIELKVPGIAKSLIAALDSSPPQKGFVISSFLPEVLAEVLSMRASAPVGLICEKKKELQRWPDLPVQYVIPHHSLVTRELTVDVHAAGKKLLIWTVNRKSAMLRFADWKVDGVISDKPELLSDTLRPRFQ
jgi:glycerophosphoryl diester phosphodiesterase